MRAVLRWTGRGLLALVVLAIIAGVGGWLYLKRSLPQLSGEARVAGIEQPIDIVRDSEGIPHVFARSERDGWFAIDGEWKMRIDAGATPVLRKSDGKTELLVPIRRGDRPTTIVQEFSW